MWFVRNARYVSHALPRKARTVDDPALAKLKRMSCAELGSVGTFGPRIVSATLLDAALPILMLPLTSNLAPGALVPMPTLTELLPNTNALLAETTALAPMAVALLSCVGVPGPALRPTNVLFEPVVLALARVAVTPAESPMAVLEDPRVFEKR